LSMSIQEGGDFLINPYTVKESCYTVSMEDFW
jgi:hypothetical protein